MKNLKILFSLVSISLLFGTGFSFDWSQCEERDFVVTAYYSPKAWQNFYYKDSFQAEKRLNGEWLVWASGKKVFNGMMDAPTSYGFGGKIYFPGLWIGEIADRGGAIVDAGNRWWESDRIDIWLGEGEAGLVRALTFWVQRRKWYYCSAEILKKWNIKTPKAGIDYGKIPMYKNFFDMSLWIQELRPERKDVWVYTLQKYLVKLGYLDKNDMTGYFGERTKIALCKFQTKKQISYPKHIHCGIYGKKTRFALKNEVKAKGLLPSDYRSATSFDMLHLQSKSRDIAEQIKVDIELERETFDKPFFKNTYDDGVIELQWFLMRLDHFEWEVDGVFDSDVINAVHKFQLAEGILQWIPSEASVAGYVGPSTRKALNIKLEEEEKQKKLAILEEALKKPEVKKKIFLFYRPYEKSEVANEEIRILQRFLTELDLYEWEVNGKYDKLTIDSVFDFQVKYGILTDDAHYTVRGFFGPGTREKVNEMRVWRS